MSSFNWSPIAGGTGGVTTINSLSGALTLAAGTGISVTDNGTDTITIASTSAGDLTLTAFGSTPSANAASLSGQALTLQPADATHPGGVSITTQSFAGNKTFTGTIAASNLSGTNTGDVTLAAVGSSPNANGASLSAQVLNLQPADATNPGVVTTASQTFAGQKTFSTGLTGTLTGAASLNVLTSALGNLTDAGTDGIVVTGGTGAVVGSVSLAQHVADTTHNGYLSSADWNTFNGKQAAGNYITALTGDATASGPGSAALTLATVNANVGSFTNASITVNAKGLVTAASSGAVAVTAVSVASANGFAGSSSGGATPALTLTTSITGVLKGNGTAISAATAGTDYSAGTSALATGILKSTTTTGALTIAVAGDFPTLNQNTTGTAAGNTTYSANNHGVVVSSATNAMTVIAPDSSTTKVLTSGGSSADPTWSAVTASSFGTQTAGTFLAGPTSGSAATPTFRALQAQVITVKTSGSSTFTSTAGVLYTVVECVGGGAGGGGTGLTTGPGGGTGGATTFSTMTAGGGAGGGTSVSGGAGGSGGASSGGDINISGGMGSAGASPISGLIPPGGTGGASAYGGAGAGAYGGAAFTGGNAGAANSGGGGGGSSSTTTGSLFGGSGGGSGGYCLKMFTGALSGVAYSVGGAGAAGVGTGASNASGGAGGSGIIIITEYFQ